MKKTLLSLVFTGISVILFAQNNIGVGTNTPDASAKMDITATDKGLLIPRVSLTNVTIGSPITSPANGLMVWNTNASVTGGYGVGFYYWGGSSWTKVATGNALSATLTNGKIWIGNASNVPTEQSISSDINIDNAGVATIQDNSVDGTDIQLTANATGDLMMYNGTDWVVLASGTNGYVLTGNGSGVAPSYKDPNTLITKKDVITPSGGAIDFISSGTSQVVGAANLSLDVITNAQTQKGIVSAPGATANKDVWGTDASGNPAWRDATNMNNVQNGININTSAPNATATDPYIELGGSLIRPTTITTPTTNNLTITNSGTANTTINLSSTGDLDIQDNGTSALFVRDDANVGIGTNAPASKLHINSTATTTGDIFMMQIPSLAANNATYMKLGKNLANGNTADMVFNYTADNHADNYLGFGFYGTPLRMLLTNDGRLSVKNGMADASSQFEVDATNRGILIPRVALTATNAAGPITLPATSLMVYNTATAGTFPNNIVPGYYYNSGTTAAPIWKRFATGFGDAWLTTGNNHVSTPAFPVTYGVSLLGANENFIGVRTNDDLVFGTSAIERMRLGFDGNLGIGTATPHALIHLGNTLNNRKIVLWESTDNSHQFYGLGINNNTLRYQVDATIANHIFYAGASATTSNELMRIQGNGNVGIGTAIPNNRLTVDAAAATATSTNTYQFAIRRAGTTELTMGSDANLTYLQSWNTRPLLINSQGNNVGIGLTTAPTYKLSVNGTIEAIDFGAAGSQNIRVGDDVFLSDLDAANTMGIYGIQNPLIASVKLGSAGPTLNGLNNTTGGNLGISISPGNNKVAADGSGIAGTGYATSTVNSFMGYGGSAAYCFGFTGYEWGSTPRSGGVHGAYSSGTWGVLGYTNSGSSSYGLYYTNFATGTGYAASGSKRYGIGAGGTGDFMGSWTRGDVIGNVNSGELIASYNQGNEITSGKQMEIVNNGTSKTIAYSSTSPDVQVNKAGVGQLVNGKATITFGEDFVALIDKNTIPVVTITPVGDCNGIHIENITSSGFTIAENQHGTSSVNFNYIVIAKRIDADNIAVPKEVLDANFDNNLKDFMFNEADREHTAKPMWWDGEKIRFDAYPADRPTKKANN